MSIDWALLTQVRDRQKAAAQERVAHERQAAERHAAQEQQARSALQQEVAAKQALWDSTVAGGAGGLSVDHLRQASAWSRSLDLRIARAAASHREAAQQAAQQQARLDLSRQQLRAAAADVDKAEQMRTRALAERRQRQELRAEDAADESAAQAWAARRAS